MSESFSENVITVVAKKPHRFYVRFEDSNRSSEDFHNEISHVYFFSGTGQSDPKKNLKFAIKVDTLLVNNKFADDSPGLHNAVIRFGLLSIREFIDKNEFVFTIEEFEKISNFPYKEGRELRTEILRFIHEINEHWPDESISFVDLQDNAIGSDEDSRNWLQQLLAEGLLENSGGFKEHSRARGKPKTVAFRISAKEAKKVSEELKEIVEFPTNNFYISVELEVEKKGAFAFVIMPFKNSEFPQEVYNNIIRPSVEENLNCFCTRNDKDIWPGQLDDKFYSHIRKCKFLIAELSTENPNVVYELGMAHAFNKEVIMLVDKKYEIEKLSFDYDKFGTVFYDDETDLESKLVDRILSLGRKLGISTISKE